MLPHILLSLNIRINAIYFRLKNGKLIWKIKLGAGYQITRENAAYILEEPSVP